MFDVRRPGRGFTTTALTFAALTVVFPPAVAAALGFAFAGQRRGDPWAPRAIVVSFISLAAGVLLGIVASTVDPETFASVITGRGRP
jgi:membrane protease YdiL (CAAX protease family)